MPTSVSAHEVRPAYLQIDQTGEARYSVFWRTPLLSGVRLPVVLQFSDDIQIVAGPAEQVLPDSVVERSIIEAPDGLVGQRINFVGLQASITDVMVRKAGRRHCHHDARTPSQAWVEVQASRAP